MQQQFEMLVNNFTCPYCPFNSLILLKLESHLQEVHGEMPNPSIQLESQCALCLENYPDDNSLYAHLRAKHVDCPDLKLCDYCEFATFIKDKFSEHISHHDALIAPRYARTCVCEKCDFVSRNSLAFLRHLRDVHKEKIVIHSCDECTYATKQMHKLRRHQDLVHKAKRLKFQLVQPPGNLPPKRKYNKKKKLVDPLSGVVARKLSFIKIEKINKNAIESTELVNGVSNLITEHTDITLSNQETAARFFKCSKCEFCHKIGWVVRRHERLQHFKKKLWKCTDCSFATYKMARLTQHKKVHETAIYICDKCEFRTANKLNFLRHSKSHEEILKCNLCSFSAFSKQAITHHRNKYHDSILGPTLANENVEALLDEFPPPEGELIPNDDEDEWEIVEEPDDRPHRTRKKTEHSLRIDPEEKRRALTCQVCGYEAKWLSELVRHNRVHTGEKPFKCDICLFETKWTGDLSRHYLIHHGLIRNFVKGPRSNKKTFATPKKPNFERSLQRSQSPIIASMNLNPCETSSTTSNIEETEAEMLIEETPEGKIIVKETSKVKATARKATKDAVKKRYNCRHCSYFTRFHSRFVAHMQAHDNKRPFKCSLCGYRSNWRWDVNKHIKNRMRTHNNASVLFLPGEDQQTLSEEKPLENSEIQDKVCHELENTDQLPVLNNHSDNEEVESENSAWFCDLVWKCTKCSFRDKNKKVVQEHFVIHMGHKSYSCKFCHYRCNWRNAMLRHIRLKHKGHSAKLECFQYEQLDVTKIDNVVSENSIQKVKCLKCKLCPYTTMQSFDMNYHVIQHKPRTGTSYKCTFCPYYVSVRQLLWNHLKLHVSNPASSMPDKPLNIGEEIGESMEVSSTNKDSENQMSPVKKKMFECPNCPYKTKSAPDLAYHSNFHKPNPNALHKCEHCDYWISKRHLLIQHMKVHKRQPIKSIKNVTEIPIVSEVGEDETLIKDYENNNANMDDDTEDDDVSSTDTYKDPEYKKNKDIPLVWIKKEGLVERVYKCRFCPHTNKRRANIRSHEKMHRKRKTVGLFKCPHCEYYVSNRGALSVHQKDHKDKLEIKDSDKEISKSNIEPSKSCSPSSTEGDPPKNLYSVYTISQPSGDITGETPVDEDQTSPLYFAISPTNRGDSKTIYRYRCGKCPALFSRTFELEIHTKFHGANHAFKCEICDYSARAQAHLTRHVNVHSMNEEAIVTKKISPDRAQFKREASPPRSLSPPSPKRRKNAYCPNVRRFKCPYCPAAFHKISGLIHHKTLHNSKQKYRCSKCSYSVRFFANLQRHAKVHLGEPEPPVSSAFVKKSASSKVFKCHKCPAAFTKEQKLQIHVRLHGSNQKYNCSHCDYSVKFFANLTRHSRVHGQILSKASAEKKSIRCERCPATFSKIAGLKCHFSFHNSNLPYKCELCDYAVNYSGNLKKHVRLHHGRTYHVPTIIRSTSVKTNYGNNNLVREKMMDVSGVDPRQLLPNEAIVKKLFQCYRCPYTSARKDSVHSHLRMHFCNHQLTCPHCDYSTELASFLKQHIPLHFRTLGSKVDAYMKHEDVQVCVLEESKLKLLEDFVLEKRKELKGKNGLICQYCDRSFIEQETLNKHESQHSIGCTEEKLKLPLNELEESGKTKEEVVESLICIDINNVSKLEQETLEEGDVDVEN